jgi:hypothetical protein
MKLFFIFKFTYKSMTPPSFWAVSIYLSIFLDLSLYYLKIFLLLSLILLYLTLIIFKLIKVQLSAQHDIIY